MLVTWCIKSGEKATIIDTENRTSSDGLSVEEIFDKQVEETQYIQDLEDFLSYDIQQTTQSIPFSSNLWFDADFDENSSVQWWLTFSQKKIIKSDSLESMDIDFDLEARQQQNDSEPIYSSWNITLLYHDDEMYAKLHRFWLFMGEWNMTAKMYSLLWDLVNEKRVNLEVNSWWIISVNKDGNIKLPYIIWTLKNVLKSEWINEDSPNFLNGISELIDITNPYIDLWISTNELRMLNHEISYYELSDENIQKIFTWSFQWKESAFDLSFEASKKWIQMRIYNMKEYDEDISDYKDMDAELFFSIQDDKKSDYNIELQYIKSQQKVADLQWKIKYANEVDFSANFVLEPLEIIAWQKISWNIKWKIGKELLNDNEVLPELSWEIVTFSEIVMSL